MMKELLKKLQKKSNKKGFTLVEIIVVLVILAILAAIAVPSVIGYVDEAKESRYIQEARSIYVVFQTEEAKAAALNNGKYCTATDVTDPVYGAITGGKAEALETLKKQIKETTTLEVSSAEATVETNNAGKETTTQWVVKWKSGDKKFVKATIKKNKDIKIDKKGSALTDLD